MRNSETGEFEIVVGNKQLLSTFFVIVLLCGAAFVMGYVLGENSRSSKTTAELGTTPAVPVTGTAEARPQPASPAAPPASAPADQPAQQPDQTAAAQAAAAQPAEAPPDQPTTKPAKELQQEAEKKPAAPPPPPAPAAGPPSYWQVTATSNAAAAQDLVQALKEKGMPARTSPGRDNLIRVLVGPYTDKTSFAKAKLDIEGAGFGTPVVAK